MRPTITDIHHDAIMTNLSIAYRNSQDSFIADQIMPQVPVSSPSDKYFIYDVGPMFTDTVKIRAPGARFPRGGWTLSTSSYNCDQYGEEIPIADEVGAAADAPLQPEQDAQQYLDDKLYIRKERMVATEFMANSIWTSLDASATDWTSSSGVPITVVQRANQAVRTLSGVGVNAAAMGEIVYDALTLNAQITGKVQYVQRALPQDIKAVMAQAMGLVSLYVSRATYNTATDGATATMSRIIDDDCLLYYRAPVGGAKVATAGALFNWAPGGGLSAMERYRDETVRSDIARAFMSIDYKVIGADLGYWLADIV
jgi:hypothetical protein